MRNLILINSTFIFTLLFPISAELQELDRSLFKSSNMVSLETAKKEMKQVYLGSGETKTLHCGCFFDKQKQVYLNSCDMVPGRLRIKEERKILKWVHAMPVSAFAGAMSCWKKSICIRSDESKFGGKNCCDSISPKFKSMKSDMHNLIPTFDWIPEINNDSYETAPFGGMSESKMCTKGGFVPAKARGNLARAYFYMSFHYRINIRDKLEDKLRIWHFEDPPDKVDQVRNSSIELVQGNRNPFIDHPEIVERVRDF